MKIFWVIVLIVLISKSLWIKSVAKWLNVNYIFSEFQKKYIIFLHI